MELSPEIIRQRHKGLVWSNRQAGDEVWIRAAILKPGFSVLLDMAQVFGLKRLEDEWTLLQKDVPHEAQRVSPTVNRILRNIRLGYERAASRH